jgi:hypothetical protein
MFTDLALVLGVIALANVVFNNFERHLPLWRRISKHGLVFVAVCLIRIYAGRIGMLVFLAAMTTGQLVLHAWWFPKNGINGLTAEPYDKYLALVSRMKSRTKE